MVVEVVRCQRCGDSLPDVLATPCSPEEEATHQSLVRERQRNKASRTPSSAGANKLKRHSSIVADMAQPLDSIKQKIVVNIAQLEKTGLVSQHNHYQAIINSIIQVRGCLFNMDVLV